MTKGLGIAALIATLLMVFPAPASAADWEEYMMICFEREGNFLYTTEGKESPPLDSNADPEVEFIRLVNTHIEDDWQPIGGISVGVSAVGQAMVRD